MTNREITDITSESLRDWFKKEKWVRISSSGNIAGDCGTSKNKKNPDRCLPKAKAQSLTKGQRAATAAKKKKAGAKGKTVVKNTKKATVKKEGLWANINAKKKAGRKPSHGNSNAHKNAEKAGKALGKESANPQDGKAAPFGSGYKKVKEEYKGKHQGTNYQWPMSQATKDRKEADKFAGSDPKAGSTIKGTGFDWKKMTKEDITNLVAGLLHEMKSSMVTLGYDLQAIQDVVDHLRSNYKEGQDYELHIGRGDDLPNAITFPRGEFRDDHDLNDMLNVAQSDEDRYDAYTDDDLNEKKDDRCTRLAKQKYDTWPSAYASGAVVRCRRGEIWKKK